ncbi:hypothetical protein QCE63_03700 [Caballeronia sp. LZ065]|uniref:hypothetical protein n=1 Tax=Caballeronia sp. LZ065 TaxID=3038571 RepID=UPI00285D46BC|nr:hypothetical protein [Caballeronia sp. LZ065]MDR5778535.1 hypothetical protein [Caballeronia sp. LZ065]
MSKHEEDEFEIDENPVHVRVMPDYASNCIWHFDGMHMDPEELPVPNDLKLRLAQWADWYNINDDFKPPEERQNRLNWDKFNAEGLAIARAIKRALPAWTVVWWDGKILSELVELGETPQRSLYTFEVRSDGTLEPLENEPNA